MTTSAFHSTVPVPEALAIPADLVTGASKQISTDETTFPQCRAHMISVGSENDPMLHMESETEDEEVKMNCIGGVRGVNDSDMNTTDDEDDDTSSDDDDDDDDDETDESILNRKQGVVNFVSVCRNTLRLLRPKATTPTGVRLTPHLEENENQLESSSESEDSDDDDSSTSSVGARGIPLSIETQSSMNEDVNAGDDEGEDDGDESDDDQDDTSLSSSNSEDVEEPADDNSCHSSKSSFDVDEVTDVEGSAERVVESDFNDDELSDILQSLGEDRIAPEPEDLDTSERFIGVMEDREDLITVPKTKRVLSFNTLAALNMDSRGGSGLSKRQKCLDDMNYHSSSLLTMFSLGPPAFSMTQMHMRQESPVISNSSDDEEDLDRQLCDELNDNPDDGRDKTPVPLLTPPGSPLTIEMEDGHITTVCEWPSNLAVENAMTAVSELRSLSPASLEDLERNDQELENLQQRRPHVEPSTLTPMLMGISVGMD